MATLPSILVGAKIGHGHYGRVYQCKLNHSDEPLAIKRLLVLKTSNFSSSFGEMDITRKMNKHPSILGLKTVVFFSDNAIEWPDDDDEIVEELRQDSIALVYPLAECDLLTYYDRMSERNEEISEPWAIRIMTQMLLGLEYIHLNGYIHRDIKPLNILYMGKDIVKICDFGVSCKYHKSESKSTELGTVYFRAPELLFGNSRYDKAVDVWAMGCTCYFVISNKYLPKLSQALPKHQNYAHDRHSQLQDIIDGLPFEVYPNQLNFYDEARSLDYTQKMLEEDFLDSMLFVSKEPTLLTDFLFNMLAFNPIDRATSTQCLDQAYLSSFKTIIRLTREEVKLVNETPVVRLASKTIRAAIKSTVLDLFINYRSEPWYKDKAIFTALCMYDAVVPRIYQELRKESEATWICYFKSCFYIAVKYYCAEEAQDLRYDKFPLYDASLQSVDNAKEFEQTILENTDHWIYDISVYDIIMERRMPNIKDTFSLLLFVLDLEHNGLTSVAAFRKWNDGKQKYNGEAETHKLWLELKSK
jgi:mitogen-activated protein kinase 15